MQQNNDSDVNGAGKIRGIRPLHGKIRGSFALAREQCESLFCCSDLQNRFERDRRSWAPWTSNFLVFLFGNRVQQNNDSYVNGASQLR